MSTVFVTGATGVLGRATIPRLLAAGHIVRALSRSAANDAAIRALCADPVGGDLFDLNSLSTAIAGAEAVLHLATKIPPSSELRHRGAWIENDRIRSEGTKHLVDAAIANGVEVFVYPSFAFVYPDSGDVWIDATSTPVDFIETLRSTIAAERAVERFAASDHGGARRGVSLRMGVLYGSELPSTDELLKLAKRGISVLGAAPDAFMPMLWIDDAATALVSALDRAPSSLYDVVDDEPLRQREVADALARSVGRRRVLSLPAWLVGVMAGPTGSALTRSLRISNRRFREATGWTPMVRDAREGLTRIAAANPHETRPRIPGVVLAGLWAMALFSLFAGVQQQFDPRSFYDRFPGLGLQWVSVDGPYNEHLLRDLGGANLAFAAIVLFTIARPTTGLVRTVAAAMLVAQVPHFAYHAVHLDVLQTTLDRVLQTGALALTLAIPLLVLLGSRGIADLTGARPSPRTDVSIEERSRPSPLIASPR